MYSVNFWIIATVKYKWIYNFSLFLIKGLLQPETGKKHYEIPEVMKLKKNVFQRLFKLFS